MKRAGVMLLSVVVLALSIGAFSVTGAARQLTIGLALSTRAEERWSKEANYFAAEAKKLGAKVVIQDANNDENIQNNQIENLISQRVDCLVIVAVNSKTAAAGVAAAKRAGIPVMAYSRMILNANIDCFIGFEVVDIGRTLAKSAVARVPKGNYMIVNGASTDNNAVLERQGYLEILRPYLKRGDLKIVSEVWCENWAPEKALAFAENALTKNNNRMDAMLCSNDGMAGGVVQALKAQRLAGKVFVCGTDGELAALQRIAEGTQTVTLLFPSKQFAESGARAAVELAKTGRAPGNATGKNNNGLKDVPTIFVNTFLVTKDNLPETAIKSGFARLADVYKNVPRGDWPEI